MLPAGKSLRTLREKLGLTMRDVDISSSRMAEKYRNEEFAIPPSRLSDIETKGVLPSIFRLYTLAVIYRRDLRELLAWYGVDMNNMAADLGMISPPRSHVSESLSGLGSVQVPICLDPGFNEERTANKVVEGAWRSEYERPIYFVETRDGHTCCWCTMRRDDLILQPHPLSPVQIRVLRHPQEAEIIGQVVGVAMKLTEWQAFGSSPSSKAQAALN